MVTIFKNIFKQYTTMCTNNIVIPISILKIFNINSLFTKMFRKVDNLKLDNNSIT